MTTEGLIDTGASITAMSQKFFNKLKGNEKFKKLVLPTTAISGANGSELRQLGCYEVPIIINHRIFRHKVFVLDNLNTEVILGIDLICLAGINIDGEKRGVFMKGERIGNLLSNKFIESLSIKEINELLPQKPTQKHGRLTKKTVIPPHHLCVLNVSAPVEERGSVFLLTPPEYNGRPDVRVYETLTQPSESGHFQLTIGNVSEEPITLDRGTIMASYTKLDNHCPMIKGPDIVQNRINTILAEENKSQDEQKTRKLSKAKADDLIRRINLRVPTEKRGKYIDLILKYQDRFAIDEYDLGRATKIKHRIRLNTNKPIYTKQFRLPLEHQEVIEEFVQNMLDKKLIEVSRSRYNSPIFCVRKSNGKWRPVVDLRKINKATVDDYYSIRDVKSCIDEIGRSKSKVFSSMDLAKGFFQQELEESSREFTAFTVPGLGSFQFTVSCFGSHGAPASFSYLITEVIRDIRELLAYLDDILCHTETHEEHLEALEKCFIRLRAYNLKLSIEKSVFGAPDTEYLGFNISGEGVKPGTEKVQVIKEFPKPKTVKEIRRFVGMASFFRELIPNFTQSSSQLTALTRKDSEWKGGELPPNADKAFQTLKKALGSSPVVAYARRDLPYKIYCDAAAGTKGDEKNPKVCGGLGAMLCQTDKEGRERVIAYASRRLKGHEENYTTYLLELLAITYACEQFHHYIYGQKKFTVFTDHKPLIGLMNPDKQTKNHDNTFNRLCQKLLTYTFDLIYRPGKDQEVPDCLSRSSTHTAEYEKERKSGEKVNNIGIKVKVISELTRRLTSQMVKYNFDPSRKSITELKDLQEKDPACKQIKERILEGLKQRNGCARIIEHNLETLYIDENGLLLRKNTNRSAETPQLVTPKIFHEELLRINHDSEIAGHCDARRTRERVERGFWWITINRDTRKYVESCLVCQKTKNPSRKSTLKYPLRQPEIPQRFNQRVHADLIGPYRSKTNNKFVLVMCDAFTKYVELVPIPDKQAETIADKITNQWILRNAPMEVLVTDNGKEFKNKDLQELTTAFSIKHIFTTPGHPQSNGQCERNNRNIIAYLKKFIDDKTENWEEFLTTFMYHHNTSWHSSSKYSPYFLRHGYQPVDVIKPIVTPHYGESWTSEMIKILKNVHEETYQNLKNAQKEQRDAYDKDAHIREFHPQDKVLLKIPPKPGLNRKFCHEWTGPHTIVEMPSDVTAVIKLSDKKRTMKIHVNRLKKFVGRDSSPPEDSHNEEEEEEEEMEEENYETATQIRTFEEANPDSEELITNEETEEEEEDEEDLYQCHLRGQTREITILTRKKRQKSRLTSTIIQQRTSIRKFETENTPKLRQKHLDQK